MSNDSFSRCDGTALLVLRCRSYDHSSSAETPRKTAFALVLCAGWNCGVGSRNLACCGRNLHDYALHCPGATKALDNQFGDQWLKTSVALLELHKVRYGKYPSSLEDLKFIGDWDRNALARVRYYSNQDRTAYYIEVETGWLGRPELRLPDEFWRGTGYTESLKPA